MVFLGMTEKLVPMDKAGRMVIPLPMRREMGLLDGGLFVVQAAPGGGLSLEPKRTFGGKLKKIGKFLVMTGGLPGNSADEVRAERDSR